MKIIIIPSMTFLMFSTLCASAETLRVDELSVNYAKVVLNDRLKIVPSSLLNIKAKVFTDVEVSVALFNSLRELEEMPQPKKNFIDKVTFLINYRF